MTYNSNYKVKIHLSCLKYSGDITSHQIFLFCSFFLNLNSTKLYQSEIGSCCLTLHHIENNGHAYKTVVSLLKLITFNLVISS